MEESAMKKIKRLFKVILIIAVTLSAGFLYFYYLCHNHLTLSYVSGANSTARSNYKMIKSYSKLKELVNFPEHGVYYIFGEQNDFQSYMVYANEFIKNDTIIYGENHEKAKSYWAVRIEDGEITSSWSYHFPLKQSQLHEYTTEEQRDLIPMWVDDRYNYAIGYYDIKNEHSD